MENRRDKVNKVIKVIIWLCAFIHGYELMQSQAQEKVQLTDKYVKELSQHSFIQYDTNEIRYFGDSSALNRFYAKLTSTLDSNQIDANVRIMHVGGSHIQADIWSGTLRSNFQTMEPNMKGERGMVFPLHIARTNNPSNYKTLYTGTWEKCRSAIKKRKCDLGLLGYRVRTYDTLTSFKIYCYDDYYPLDYESNCIKLYYAVNESSFTPFIEMNGTWHQMTVNKELGYAEFGFDSYQDTISFKVARTDSCQEYFEMHGIQLENDDRGVVYHNIGVNGADVPAYMHSQRLEDHLKTIDVDLVIFSIGINDAYDANFTAESYKNNYDTLITMFRKVHPEVNILFTTNNDSHRRRKPNQRAFEVRRVMEWLCKEHNAVMWDMFEVMGGLGSMDKWVAEGMAKRDRIHFNSTGYRLIGNMMFNALMKDYQRYLDTYGD